MMDEIHNATGNVHLT